MREDPHFRVYVGNVPDRVSENDLRRHFDRAGRISSVTVKTNFAFLDFTHRQDVSYAIKHYNQSNLFGKRILVEEARGTPRERENRDGYRSRSPRREMDNRRGGYSPAYRNNNSAPPKPAPSRKLSYRILVMNLPADCTWSDLKDHMKQAGHVNYTACNDIITTVGIVEYDRSKDIKKAVEMFNNTEFLGKKITIIDPKCYAELSDDNKDSPSSNKDIDNVSFHSVDKYSTSRTRSKSTQRSHSPDSPNKANGDHSAEDKEKSKSVESERSRSKTPTPKSEHAESPVNKRSKNNENLSDATPSKQPKLAEDQSPAEECAEE